jgi:hypothetical protein
VKARKQGAAALPKTHPKNCAPIFEGEILEGKQKMREGRGEKLTTTT